MFYYTFLVVQLAYN